MTAICQYQHFYVAGTLSHLFVFKHLKSGHQFTPNTKFSQIFETILLIGPNYSRGDWNVLQ